MRREKQLVKRLNTLHTLSEAVTAMKSLSAHHFLSARRSLKAAREYRASIDQIVEKVQLQSPAPRTGDAGILVITSDLGLCADYNTRLIEYLGSQRFIDVIANRTKRIYVMGRRGKMILQKRSIRYVRDYSAPASMDGLPNRLLQVAEDVVSDYSKGEIASLEVISGRFAGAGKFDVAQTQVLPIHSSGHGQDGANASFSASAKLHRYQRREVLLTTLVREYLYITLFQILIDALASEHGMRLVAAENARQWVEENNSSVRRQLSAVRRENSTQEVLDIVGASRHSQRTSPHSRKR